MDEIRAKSGYIILTKRNRRLKLPDIVFGWCLFLMKKLR